MSATEVLIKLASPEGLEMENEARAGADGSIFQPTIRKVFQKQTGNSSCGIQSCGILLNAGFLTKMAATAPAPVPYADLPFTETKMYAHPATLSVTTYDRVQTQGFGCNLNEVENILKAHGCIVENYHISPALSVQHFRDVICSGLKRQNTGVIANYFMNAIDPSYPFYGHHSPLGGYHGKSDRFLILDVWPATDEGWVKTEHLYNAMNTLDEETGETRGFVIAQAQ